MRCYYNYIIAYCFIENEPGGVYVSLTYTSAVMGKIQIYTHVLYTFLSSNRQQIIGNIRSTRTYYSVLSYS